MKNNGTLDIMFLGGLFPKELEDEIITKSKGTIQYAGNAVQWSLVKGFDKAAGSIKVLTAPRLGAFPVGYKDLFIRSVKWRHAQGADDKAVRFCNLFGVEQLSRGFSLARESKKWAREEAIGKKVLIVYSIHTPFLYAATKAKKQNPDLHVCLICPDLPQYMNLKARRSLAYRILKPIDIAIINRLLDSVDSFVFVTKYMAEQVNLKGRPWIVMEGIVDAEELQESDFTKQEKKERLEKVVLYTGTLDFAYGIGELLEAFEMIEDNDIQLWICGAGEAEKEVRIAASKDKRIKYFGQVPRSEVLRLQREADLLVNPRNDKGEFTKYSFPSKLMEYMLSGTPALIHRLPGIPDEYFDYVFEITENNPEGLSKSIKEAIFVISKGDSLIGDKARDFVLLNKRNEWQAERILNLITSNELNGLCKAENTEKHKVREGEYS